MKIKTPQNLSVIIISVIFSIIIWGSISLSSDYFAVIEVPLKLVNIPKGLTSGSVMPDKILIKVKSKGWKLISMNVASPAEFVVPLSVDSGFKFINLNNYLSENNWLSEDMQVMDIIPDTISFYIESIGTKKLPIEANLNLNFKTGYGLASEIKFIPDSVMVTGPKSILKGMKSINTERSTYNNLSEKIVERIEVKKLRGFSYSADNLLMSLDVQAIIDKSFEEIPVKVLNVPPDREVVLIPNLITVSVLGGIEVLGKLSENDFSASIEYGEVVVDSTGTVSPEIDFPDNTQLIYIKPERLRYVITKFN
ncbi:MAG: hypothetical protein IPJ03_04185 [Ignavibacteriales bacterium]|nr:hypothetical protein [Ignavibacteriales bacterium]